jgi:hypothetical protein
MRNSILVSEHIIICLFHSEESSEMLKTSLPFTYIKDETRVYMVGTPDTRHIIHLYIKMSHKNA